MKKNVLALSITAALIGLTGGAHAMSGFGELRGSTADSFITNTAGVGHALVVPYFSTQGNNTTLINIVNTDSVGKVLKVRFRGAANSDDLFDFQVFLSPYDVWTASLSKGVTDGKTRLTTVDNSCTKPSKTILNGTPFITTRLDPQLTDAQKANGTREGYVEVFNMADIVPGSALATGITHSQSTGIPPLCGGTPSAAQTAVWNALDESNTLLTYAKATTTLNLANPTTGVLGNWTIIDTENTATWSGSATALEAVSAAAPFVKQTGNIVYFPQISELLPTTADNMTADPVFVAALRATAGNTKWLTLDLPDMSTPYVSAVLPVTTLAVTASKQSNLLSGAIATTSISNEFWTESAFAASNDWVISQFGRRYAAAIDYTSGTDLYTAGTYYYAKTDNVRVKANAGNGRQLCLYKPGVFTASPVDREEKVPVGDPTQVVISPNDPKETPALELCGEVAVMSINNGGVAAGSGALKASVALTDYDSTVLGGSAPQRYGWIKMALPSLTANPGYGLPVLGGSFVRAALGTKGFGAKYEHNYARPTMVRTDLTSFDIK
jgi:hypothetical protein